MQNWLIIVSGRYMVLSFYAVMYESKRDQRITVIGLTKKWRAKIDNPFLPKYSVKWSKPNAADPFQLFYFWK